MCRSKGMAVRGLMSGGDPRSGEDERQRTFRRHMRPVRRLLRTERNHVAVTLWRIERNLVNSLDEDV